MPEQLLDGAEGGAGIEQVGGEGVPERVGAEPRVLVDLRERLHLAHTVGANAVFTRLALAAREVTRRGGDDAQAVEIIAWVASFAPILPGVESSTIVLLVQNRRENSATHVTRRAGMPLALGAGRGW